MNKVFVSYLDYHKARENFCELNGLDSRPHASNWDAWRDFLGLDIHYLAKQWVNSPTRDGWMLPERTANLIRALGGPHYRTIWKMKQVQSK